MALSDSPVRHRLELLERTVYALQAQQRVLDYRMQYLEDENKSLRQGQPKKEDLPINAFAQTPTPKGSLNPNAYAFELRSLGIDKETHAIKKEASTPPQIQELSSLSLLDEPSVLSTPILIPVSKVTVPAITGLGLKFPSLTPINTERSESVLIANSQKHSSTLPASLPLSDSPEANGLKNAPINSTKTPAVSEEKKQDNNMVPWDGTIAWKFIRLFKDKDEEKQAMLNSMADSELKLQDEWIFQYGLRYLPKADDKDVYRTIRIENLPENITLDKVLAEVCYGAVFSADLLNTLPIAGYHTARVVFLHQQSASKFCKYVKKKGLIIQGAQARVALERTATYPVGLSLQESISKDGCTRCVAITGVTESMLACIEDIIAGTYLHDCVETYSKQHADIMDDGTDDVKVCIRFHSMKAAMFAHRMFQQSFSLRDCVIKYEEDPCNRTPV